MSKNLITLIVLCAIGGAILFTIPWKNDIDEKMYRIVRKEKERAYLEGQRDALTGDVRIIKTDSTWEYIKSPWDHETNLSTTQHLSIPLN